MTLEFNWQFKDQRGKKETAFIYRHGLNDYSVYYEEEDYSLRGSLLDVMVDLKQRRIVYELFAYNKDADTYDLIASDDNIKNLEAIGHHLNNYVLIDKKRNEEIDWLIIATNEETIEFLNKNGQWVKED